MSTYTESLGLELITPGSQAGLWGNTTNNTFNLIDQAITGVTPISFAAASGATYTLTDYNGAEDEARSAVLNVTGTASGTNTIIIPNKQKTYFVRNSTGKDIIVQTALGTTPCTVGAGYNLPVFCDGNNEVFLAIVAPGAGTLTVTGGGTGVTTFGSGGFVKSPGSSNPLTVASTVALGSEVSGTLPVANGGTGQTSLAPGGILFGNGTGAIGSFVGGASGQVATWNGSAWVAQTPTTGGVTSVSGSGINVSPTSGNVVVTLTSGNVTGALGYTPYNSTNPAGYVTSSGSVNYATSAGTATSASTATTATNLSGGSVNATTANFSGQVICTGGIRSQAYNFTDVGNSIFYSGGVVQIAVGYSFNFNFYTNGNAIAVNGSWINGSDERIKENVHTTTDGLNAVMRLRPIKFSFKRNKLSSANKYGFIAQELEQVLPDVVYTNENKEYGIEDFKSVGYSEIVPVLVKAIQELKAEVDALKAAK